MVYKTQIAVKDQYLISIKSYNMLDVYQAYWDKFGKPTFGAEESRFD
jgi:hypothetical protein